MTLFKLGWEKCNILSFIFTSPSFSKKSRHFQENIAHFANSFRSWTSFWGRLFKSNSISSVASWISRIFKTLVLLCSHANDEYLHFVFVFFTNLSQCWPVHPIRILLSTCIPYWLRHVSWRCRPTSTPRISKNGGVKIWRPSPRPEKRSRSKSRIWKTRWKWPRKRSPNSSRRSSSAKMTGDIRSCRRPQRPRRPRMQEHFYKTFIIIRQIKETRIFFCETAAGHSNHYFGR